MTLEVLIEILLCIVALKDYLITELVIG